MDLARPSSVCMKRSHRTHHRSQQQHHRLFLPSTASRLHLQSASAPADAPASPSASLSDWAGSSAPHRGLPRARHSINRAAATRQRRSTDRLVFCTTIDAGLPNPTPVRAVAARRRIGSRRLLVRRKHSNLSCLFPFSLSGTWPDAAGRGRRGYRQTRASRQAKQTAAFEALSRSSQCQLLDPMPTSLVRGTGLPGSLLLVLVRTTSTASSGAPPAVELLLH